MKRSPLKRGTSRFKRTALKRKTARPKPAIPAHVRERVFVRDAWQCVACAHEARGAPVLSMASLDPHHLLPKQASGFPGWVAERTNIVSLCRAHHAAVEFSPNYRLPWEALPLECQLFLTIMAGTDGRAERVIQTNYPKEANLS